MCLLLKNCFAESAVRTGVLSGEERNHFLTVSIVNLQFWKSEFQKAEHLTDTEILIKLREKVRRNDHNICIRKSPSSSFSVHKSFVIYNSKKREYCFGSKLNQKNCYKALINPQHAYLFLSYYCNKQQCWIHKTTFSTFEFISSYPMSPHTHKKEKRQLNLPRP